MDETIILKIYIYIKEKTHSTLPTTLDQNSDHKILRTHFAWFQHSCFHKSQSLGNELLQLVCSFSFKLAKDA